MDLVGKVNKADEFLLDFSEYFRSCKPVSVAPETPLFRWLRYVWGFRGVFYGKFVYVYVLRLLNPELDLTESDAIFSAAGEFLSGK